jgi:feruloyl-CoA synthase
MYLEERSPPDARRGPALGAPAFSLDRPLDDAFQLSCGRWVDATALRRAVVASCGPLLSDVVIVGEDRQDVCLLAFTDEHACRTWLRTQLLDDDLPEYRPHLHALVWDEIAQELQTFNDRRPASFPRIARFSIMPDPPSREGGEVNNVGVLDDHAVRLRRVAQIEELYRRTRS